MSHFKINPITQQHCCSTARIPVTGSLSLTAFFLGNWNQSRQHVSWPSLALSICQSSLWGSSIHRQPQCFIWAQLSSHYRCKCCLRDMPPERKRCNPERTSAASRRVIIPRRLCLFSEVTQQHQPWENHQSQHLDLQLRNVRHPESGRKTGGEGSLSG